MTIVQSNGSNSQHSPSSERTGVFETFDATSDDIEEHQAAVGEIDQRYRQLGTGSFHGRFTGFRTSDCVLFREYTSPSVLEQGWAINEGTLVAIPLTPGATAWLCGHDIPYGYAAVLKGGREFAFRAPDALELAVILVFDDASSTKALKPHRNTVSVRPLVSPQRFVQSVSHLLDAAFESSVSTAQPALISAQARALASSIALPTDEIEKASASSRQRFALVNSALALIHGEHDLALDVAMMCRRLRVSRRCLQDSFQLTLQISPGKYLMRQRLHSARQALMRASATTTVASVALNSGFSHLGRFSTHYRGMFGELPSTTLNRTLLNNRVRSQ